MRWPRIAIPWLWVAAGVCGAGVIHVATVFAIPLLTERDAWQRLGTVSSANQLYILPPGTPDDVLPSLAPDIVHAFCRFDLTDGNVALYLPIGAPNWMLSLSARRGENFYVTSGAELKRRDVRILVVPRARLAAEASSENTVEGDEQIIVIAPEMQGIVMIRAPIRGPSFVARTVDTLQGARCERYVEPPPELVAETPPPPEEPRSRQRRRR